MFLIDIADKEQRGSFSLETASSSGESANRRSQPAGSGILLSFTTNL
jgi:hypothetical protein